MSTTSFLDEIEKNISYGENVNATKDVIRGVLEEYCADMEKAFSKKFPELQISCRSTAGLSEPERQEMFVYFDGIKNQYNLQIVFIQAKKLVQLDKSSHLTEPAYLPPTRKETFALFRYAEDVSFGFPVYLLFNFDKVYCSSEDELKQGLMEAFKARSSELLNFLKNI